MEASLQPQPLVQNGPQSLQLQQTPATSGPSPLPQQLQQFTQRPKSPQSAMSQAPIQTPMFPPGVKVPQAEQQQAAVGAASAQGQQSIGTRPSSTSQSVPLHRPNVPAAFPGSLSDLVVSFENVKQKGDDALLRTSCSSD